MMKNWKNEMIDSSIVKFQKNYGFSSSYMFSLWKYYSQDPLGKCGPNLVLLLGKLGWTIFFPKNNLTMEVRPSCIAKASPKSPSL
jgi:hypothetical protein